MTGFEAKAERIRAEVRGYLAQEKKLLLTSSFQTHSIPLLHILKDLKPSIPVYFLETNYHFPETHAFRDRIAALLGLELRELKSTVPVEQQTGPGGRPLYETDRDACCGINKVAPLDALLPQFDVWISGVRADQTATRAAMDREMPGKNGTLRYHPMLDWTAKDIYYYRQAYGLPEHPLEAEGYLSIGCAPCTAKPALEGDERSGRWAGSGKVECGLHTELVRR